ncbi:RNA ligase family protein [Deinococcus maricopensis]|uniref:RNA ligase domain-containing protein n=1 Tax=Deinococcus maricopensis (strain DSM 21211 / LMG 22137 / NRRL B-23946 / LB-34) TaxID=709986 RepID=E8U8X1_DEIML|nr:RNA ligase family protein [Deinococcus maricopensis]ADV67510.1 hypothetical protein Deima_1863 [Deinococcus maricopensis DSM 21211]
MDARRPLGHPAYGRIPHLPGSRAGADDEHLPRTLTPGPHDTVWVQEKLDGTNVAVARVGDDLIALNRAGYRARDSRRLQGRLFDAWVHHHAPRFLAVLQPGERLIGEWLLYAHGTHYHLPHEPFVALDLMRGHERTPLPDLHRRLRGGFVTPHLHAHGARDLAALHAACGHGGHGARTPPEGFIYRVERARRVLLVAKWVQPAYVTGAHFQDGEVVRPNVLRAEDDALLARLRGTLHSLA